MGKLDYLSEEMVEETLKEAADTFFSKRKKIDEELELLSEHAEQLRKKEDLIEQKTSRLNYLLMDDDSRNLFWNQLGLKDSIYPSIKPQWGENNTMPWALTIKGKYQKALLSVYDDLRSLVKDYLHGRYIDHPEIKGKKVITPNFLNLKKWADDINKEIENINRCNKPDDVMAFSRRMDVSESSKRESVGSGLEYDFDKELCLPPFDFSSLKLKEYPELPGGKKDYYRIAEVCMSIYKAKKEQVNSIIKSIYKK